MSQSEPDTIGKYDIVREVGRGNMATVYLANDSFYSRQVAVKVAHPEMLKDVETGAQFRKMFFNEAKVAGMLKHPNTVAIYDAGVEGDICYMAMEYVPGDRTLKDFVRPDRLLPIEDVAQIAFKCAKALDHAHKKGVIHRDIKPGNILLTEDGDVKIVDFGIAVLVRGEATGTQVEATVGSPLYMSPEQLNQDEITNQTDIFSFGVVMYEMLTGQHPFIASSLPAIVNRVTNENPTPPIQIRPTIPDVLNRIVRKAMRKNPAKRYKTGMDLAADLTLVFENLNFEEEDIPDNEKFNLVQDLQFFKDFTEPEVWEVIHASKWEEYPTGKTIVSDGEVDSSFYVIVSGTAGVHKAGQHLVDLGPGECFGEMGFISKEARSADVVAANDVYAMKVSASLIERASTNCQLRFHKVFLTTLVARLRGMNERLSL